MNPPATGTKFLDDPTFWEKYSGFFFDKEKLLEFAEAIAFRQNSSKKKRANSFKGSLSEEPHI